MRVEKVKTRRGKSFLDDRAPKIVENDKAALIIRGNKSSEVVIQALNELYMLKKPLANRLMRYLLDGKREISCTNIF
jgi:ribosome production factor 2